MKAVETSNIVAGMKAMQTQSAQLSAAIKAMQTSHIFAGLKAQQMQTGTVFAAIRAVETSNIVAGMKAMQTQSAQLSAAIKAMQSPSGTSSAPIGSRPVKASGLEWLFVGQIVLRAFVAAIFLTLVVAFWEEKKDSAPAEAAMGIFCAIVAWYQFDGWIWGNCSAG